MGTLQHWKYTKNSFGHSLHFVNKMNTDISVTNEHCYIGLKMNTDIWVKKVKKMDCMQTCVVTQLFSNIACSLFTCVVYLACVVRRLWRLEILFLKNNYGLTTLLKHRRIFPSKAKFWWRAIVWHWVIFKVTCYGSFYSESALCTLQSVPRLHFMHSLQFVGCCLQLSFCTGKRLRLYTSHEVVHQAGALYQSL